ncbi:flagellin [Synergistales bacterium]|nr:flagellin [Synergistales bacterium]
MRILQNIPALVSYNALTKTNNSLAKSIERLSTGLRINSAADDAAGLAISEKMRSQISGLNQATRNAQDGISMIQTAEGALAETHSMLQRMRELSIQSANDTLTQEDRSYIQLEIDQLKDEIDRISTTTQFNKKQLLDGSAGALWSTDNLATKVIVRGGLREVDQFGQKKAREGNFKVKIDALPGESQVKKSDIFKIKHPNVIMNVGLNTALGFESVRVDGLPAGTYNVSVGTAADPVFSARATYIANGSAGATVDSYIKVDTANLVATANLSMLFEVVAVNNASGSNILTVRVQTLSLDSGGNVRTYSNENILITTSNMVTGNMGIGLTNGANGKGFMLTANVISNFSVGDKWVYGMTVEGTPASDATITIDAKLNSAWPDAWKNNNSAVTPYQLNVPSLFNVKASAVQNLDVHFKNFYLNEQNGSVYESNVVVRFNENFAAVTGGTKVGATFEAAYIGQVAKGDVQLRDLDKYWNANGKFLLDTPKTIQIVQGDGTKASITLYSTDTIEDVRKKLNNAIAFDLGQAKYSPQNSSNFVSFVEQGKELPNSPVSVPGTFVIRSLIPGNDGTLSFSGDEDIIRTFSLNVIREPKESQFRVAVYDAHTGATVSSNVKINGNILYGIVAPNIDVRFDPMADIKATWNDKTKNFDLIAMTEEYSTIVHLSDNSTIFQVGANESEDMSIDMGNMSSLALGITNVIVTDRESAGHAIGKIDNAIGLVSAQRAKLGAYQNRLEHTVNNLTTAATNTTAAESRIRDADMAQEMMTFTKLNILSQAGTSMLAQANQLPQNILSLLRG